jgi:2-(1,2-epoxy-1,2-dihydrophenyl)acetyl-CoA isomerase
MSDGTRSDGAYGLIAVSVDGPVGTITLNRAEKLNALTVEMVGELAEALTMLAAAEAVRVIVITGAGKAFCSGADVSLLRDLVTRGDEATGRRLVDSLRAVAHGIREAPQPVLACVNGVAAGGGANLALACDLRIAADTAQIGQVFMKIGLHPDFGGTYYLPRLVGASKALELILGADLVGASEALRLGIVNRVVPAADLAAATRAWAQQIAAAPPLAVRRAKRAVYLSERATMDEMLDYELEAQIACFTSADGKEGIAAFFEKRPPHFTGR